MNNVALLKQGYENFAEGNIEAVVAIMHHDIEWNESQGFPFIKGEGISIGPESVVQDIFSQLPSHYDNFNIDIKELIGIGDKVVMVGYYTGNWKETGKEFRANAVHVWTVRNNEVTHFFQAVDTAEIINP